ncbi:hypothetical protein D3C78_1289960 [compost metagenome]
MDSTTGVPRGAAIRRPISSVELRVLVCSSWPTVRVRLSISLEVIWPPSNSCGSMRPSLKFTTGSLGCRVPRRSSVLDTLALAVRPALL